MIFAAQALKFQRFEPGLADVFHVEHSLRPTATDTSNTTEATRRHRPLHHLVEVAEEI